MQKAILLLALLIGCFLFPRKSFSAPDPTLAEVKNTIDATKPVTQSVRRLDGRVLTPDQVESAVERLMTAGKVPGLALAILNDGEIVYLRGFGLRNVEQLAPLNESTIMYAASFTKSIFAFMVMQLVAEGSFDLDKPIGQYLKRSLSEYEKYSDLAGDNRWERFTGRMLLSHTSGLPNWRWFNPDEKLDIKFDPGSKYSYSGEGINLLQFVIEEHIGRSVGDMMKERVFGPFGMTRTNMVWDPSFEDNFALGYDEQGKVIGHKKRQAPRAAGSADSDITGIARFLRGVLRGEGLPPRFHQEMLSPTIRIRSRYQFPTPSEEWTDRDDAIRLSYGLGWGLFWSPYGKAFFKEGHDDGWENYMVAFEDSKTALIVMASSSNGESIFVELLEALIADTYSPSAWNRYVPYSHKQEPSVAP
ncbi:MAG: serine hydrolase domain-containing protein [Planctomycetota bacterium]